MTVVTKERHILQAKTVMLTNDFRRYTKLDEWLAENVSPVTSQVHAAWRDDTSSTMQKDFVDLKLEILDGLDASALAIDRISKFSGEGWSLYYAFSSVFSILYFHVYVVLEDELQAVQCKLAMFSGG